MTDRASRLPDLGSRGQGWVLLQGALLLSVAASAVFAGPWPDTGSVPRLTTGAAVTVAGLALLFAGSRALGPSLTPLPRPREDAVFRDDGIYGRARHPIYGGVLLLALGISLFTSPVGLVPTACSCCCSRARRDARKRGSSIGTRGMRRTASGCGAGSCRGYGDRSPTLAR